MRLKLRDSAPGHNYIRGKYRVSADPDLQFHPATHGDTIGN
jgi:hypothetical protein